MSCFYCENYPDYTSGLGRGVHHGDKSVLFYVGSGKLSGYATVAPKLRVDRSTYKCPGVEHKTLGEVIINYCPWCGRDLRCADETETDDDEEPDEEAQGPSEGTETKLDALRDAIRAALGLELWDEDEEPDAATTPDYYTADGIEAIDVIEAVCKRAQLAPQDVFCLGNVLKYALRAGRKGGTRADFESDCQKAANYAHRMVTGEWPEV